MTKLSRALLAVLLVCLAACRNEPPQARSETDDQKVYRVKGIVRSAPDFSEGSVMIEHEDIPGFMPAMTMPFEFREAASMKGIAVGDGLAFDFVVTETDSWITRTEKIDPAAVNLPKKGVSTTAQPKTQRLKEGQPLPDFKLVDQAGRALSRETFAGKPLVLTFMFTRCPVPNFCPLMAKNFQEVERAIEEDPAFSGKVSLLSISFDEYDTPEVLAEYGKQWTQDLDRWRFATGSGEEVQKLAQAFAVQVKPDAATINHSLATALIGADGTIQRIWRGNGWKPAEVMNALRESKPSPTPHLSQLNGSAN